MSSNYDALSGGVSAFGGLGRDFGRVGRLGALGTAQVPSSPTITAGQPIGLLLALTQAFSTGEPSGLLLILTRP